MSLARIVRPTQFRVLSALLLCVGTTMAAEPAVVLSIRSFQELLTDTQYLGNATGQPLLGAIVPGMVAQLTGGKGLKGLDTSKPIGLYLTFSTDGEPRDAVAFVPVANQKQFADNLATVFPNNSTQDGITKYQPPNSPQPLFGKIGPKYFLMAQSAEALKDAADPDKLVKSTSDIALELDLTKLSDALKEQFLAKAEAAGAAAAERNNRAASDAERQGEEAGRKIFLASLRRIVLEGARVSFGLNVDAKGKHVSLNLGFTARAGTTLAQACDGFAKTESPFSALVSPQTIGSLLISSPISADAQGTLSLLIDTGETGALEAVRADARLKDSERPAAEKFVQRVSEAIRQSATRGRWDQAVVVNAADGGQIQVLAAMKIAQGKELDKLFEEAVKQSRSGKNPVQLGVSEASGVRIHAVKLPPDADRERHLGSGAAHLAIGDETLVLGIGGDSLAKVKEALATKPDQVARVPVSLRLRLSKLLPLAADANPQLLELSKSAFENGRDELALEIASQPQGATLRFEIQEGALRWFGLAATTGR